MKRRAVGPATRFTPLVGSLVLAVGAAGIMWWSVARGRALQRDQQGLKLGAAPLVGRDEYDGWDWRFSWWLVVAAAIVIAVAATVGRGWWQRMSVRVVVATAAIGSAAFAVVLALTDGTDGLRFGAEHPTEYWVNLPNTPPAAAFVRHFTENIRFYSVHVRGHPPGFVLVLKAVAWVGPDGVWPVVALSVGGCAAVVVAVLWTVRSVVDEACCRAVAPFLVVAPFAIWMVTSADAFFSALAATGVGCLANALWRSPGWRRTALAATGGILLGGLLFMTYLGTLYAAVPAAVIGAGLVARRWRSTTTVVGVTTLAVAAVVVTFAVAGFWWFDGARVTSHAYRVGSAQFRPFSYFWIGNLGAAIFAIGPMTVLALGRLRNRRAWWLVAGGLLGILLSDFSGVTKGEVERIWLLFYPWIVVASAALWSAHRRWLAPVAITVQGVSSILLQAALVSKW